MIIVLMVDQSSLFQAMDDVSGGLHPHSNAPNWIDTNYFYHIVCTVISTKIPYSAKGAAINTSMGEGGGGQLLS